MNEEKNVFFGNFIGVRFFDRCWSLLFYRVSVLSSRIVNYFRGSVIVEEGREVVCTVLGGIC